MLERGGAVIAKVPYAVKALTTQSRVAADPPAADGAEPRAPGGPADRVAT